MFKIKQRLKKGLHFVEVSRKVLEVNKCAVTEGRFGGTNLSSLPGHGFGCQPTFMAARLLVADKIRDNRNLMKLISFFVSTSLPVNYIKQPTNL